MKKKAALTRQIISEDRGSELKGSERDGGTFYSQAQCRGSSVSRDETAALSSACSIINQR